MTEGYIAYKRANDQWNMGRYHFHEEYEILLSLSENAQMFVTDRCYPLQYGSLLLLPPAILHRSVANSPQQYNRYVIRFHKQYADSLSTNATNLLRCFQLGRIHYQLNQEQTEKLSALYRDCIDVRSGFGADLRRDIAFTLLMLYVDEVIDQSHPTLTDQTSWPNGNMSEILSYIPDHLTEDLSLDTLSAKFFISKPHLCRIFKESTGFPPGEYIIKSRIMHARRLLQEGKSVQEAGEASGFRSYAHFIRTFRQIVGVSPGKYKAN